MELADLGEQVFAVEKILKKRYRRGQIEFLVKWKDWPDRYNSWEPKDNILDQRLIFEFYSRFHGEFGEPRKGRKPRKRRFSHQPGDGNRSSSDNGSLLQVVGQNAKLAKVAGDGTVVGGDSGAQHGRVSVQRGAFGGENGEVGGGVVVGDNTENGGLSSFSVCHISTKHVYGVGRNGGSTERGCGVSEAGTSAVAMTGQHPVTETENGHNHSDGGDSTGRKSPLVVDSKVLTPVTSSGGARSLRESWTIVPMQHRHNSRNGDIHLKKQVTGKQRSTNCKPASPKSDQENISADTVPNILQEQYMAGAPNSHRTLTPLYLWQPKKQQSSLAVIDSVAITDVTAQNFTVTIRESYTDVGFFKFRDGRPDPKTGRDGESPRRENQKTKSSETDENATSVKVSVEKDRGDDEQGRDGGIGSPREDDRKTERGETDETPPNKEHVKGDDVNIGDGDRATGETRNDENAQTSVVEDGCINHVCIGVGQKPNEDTHTGRREDGRHGDGADIEQVKDQNANELFPLEKDIKAEAAADPSREKCAVSAVNGGH